MNLSSELRANNPVVSGLDTFDRFPLQYPEFLKVIRGGLKYLLFGRDFQWRSTESIRQFQLERLRIMLRHCHENIPFYQERFRRAGFHPNDLRSWRDLEQLPVLEKRHIREHFWQLIDRRRMRKGILCQTSGTTGEPLRFLLSPRQVTTEWADIWRCWIWAGYRPHDRVAAFRHYEPKPGEPISRFERHTNTLFFSVYDMEEGRLREYVSAFNRFAPRFVRGYPSSLYILASFAREKRLMLHSPHAIITSSETLQPQYRSLIEEVFDCPVYDWYGTNERIVTAYQCERRGPYHLSATSGVAEFLDAEVHSARDAEARSLVVTTLVNKIMPLIRYRVGDVVMPEDSPCECGRGLPLIRAVLGRSDDIIITGGSRYVSPIRFYVLFQEFDAVRQFQVVQKHSNQVLIRIVTARELSRPEYRLLNDKLRRLLGEPVRCEFEFVQEIEPEPSGKVRNIVSPVSRFTREHTTLSD